jgi:hypothetical protein
MTYPENVRHGLWGVVGILIPTLFVIAAYGVPSIVALVAVAVAFFIGEQRGRRETGDSYKEVLQEDLALLKEGNRLLEFWMNKAVARGEELQRLRYRLDIAGKKVQKLTERFVRNGK